MARRAALSLGGAVLLSGLASAVAPTFANTVQAANLLSEALSEPSLALKSDGTIIMVNVHPTATFPFLARQSTDDGETWTNIDPPENLLFTIWSDTDVAVDPCDDQWAVRAHGTQIYMYRRQGSGAWEQDAAKVPSAPTVLADRPWVTTGDCEEVFVNALSYDGALWYESFFYRHPVADRWDTGGYFEIRGATGCCGNILYDDDDNYVFALYRAPNGDVKLARSGNHGNTFSHFVVRTDPGDLALFPVLTEDAGGNLYAVYIVLSGRVQYHYSTDNGATWSSAITVGPVGGSNVFPWAVAGATGKLDIVWYRADVVPANPNSNPGPWYVNMTQVTSANSASPGLTDVRATSVSIHNDEICTQGAACGLLNPALNRSMGDFFEVAKDGSGFAQIAFSKHTDASGDTIPNTRMYFVRQNGGDTIG